MKLFRNLALFAGVFLTQNTSATPFDELMTRKEFPSGHSVCSSSLIDKKDMQLAIYRTLDIKGKLRILHHLADRFQRSDEIPLQGKELNDLALMIRLFLTSHRLEALSPLRDELSVVLQKMGMLANRSSLATQSFARLIESTIKLYPGGLAVDQETHEILSRLYVLQGMIKTVELPSSQHPSGIFSEAMRVISLAGIHDEFGHPNGVGLEPLTFALTEAFENWSNFSADEQNRLRPNLEASTHIWLLLITAFHRMGEESQRDDQKARFMVAYAQMENWLELPALKELPEVARSLIDYVKCFDGQPSFLN